ncbi:CAP domain-containing protein [Leptolyngbya sp. FACHB-711]|uniref:CAP domain-containing protein n=1 Tax=unclassified Leptolyngbya TaxID=2650499 RepID=UPI0018EFB27D|nr:CAP domain-containing protein [Leptolyngbya sp. FACHB-711]
MRRTLSDLSAAKGIPSTAAIRDRVNSSNSSDLFRFDLAQPSGIRIKFRSSRQGANLRLVQDRNFNGRIDTGEIVQSAQISFQQKEVSRSQLAAGTYYLQVSAGGQGANRYQLNLETSASSNSSSLQTGLPAPQPVSVSVIDQIVSLTNDFRRQNGLPPVTLNPLLGTAAQTQSQNMALEDYFDHTSPTGVTPGQRATAAGYRWSRVAENIGAGHTTAVSVVQGWINSPGHRANLLDPKLREIGVGYYFMPSDTGTENWNHYWTQVLAAPM